VSKCLKGEKGTPCRILINKCMILGEGIGSVIFQDGHS
jgi:hypothetical protein